MKSRRVVEHGSWVPRGRKGRKGPKLWAYGYPDLARLLGTTEGALRARVARKTFDPASLEAVVLMWAKLRTMAARRERSIGRVLHEAIPGTTVVMMPGHHEVFTNPATGWMDKAT